MFEKIITTLPFFLILFASYVAPSMAGGAENFNITWVGVDLVQQVLFVGINPPSALSSCGIRNELKWNLTDPGVKELMSTVLSAQAMSKLIQVAISPNCVANQATGLWLKLIN